MFDTKKGDTSHDKPRHRAFLTLAFVASALVGCSASAEGRISDLDDDMTTTSCSASALEGEYESPGPSFEADTGACIDLARDLQKRSIETTFALTKVGADTYETRRRDVAGEAPNTYTLERGSCELIRRSTASATTADLAGNPVRVTLASVVKVRGSGDRLNGDQSIEVTSETSGAKGFPCTIKGRNVAIKR